MPHVIPLQTAIHGTVVGLVSAHPDDHIPHANLLWTLHEQFADVTIHELVQTKGKGGINLRRDEPDFVTSGQRETEGRASAQHFGITSYAQLDNTDGGLQGEETAIAETIVSWAQEHNVTTLVSLRTGDHTDHTAVADAARLAAAALGRPVHVLELLPLGASSENTPEATATEDITVVNTSEASTVKALEAASINKSQFEITKGHRRDWINEQVFSLEPETHERLFQYPIAKAADYHVLRFGI